MACSSADEPPASERAQTSDGQALSPRYAERLVPIRFISMRPTAAGGAGGNAPYVTDLALRQSVEAANHAFKGAGVQFTVKANVAAVMPNAGGVLNNPAYFNPTKTWDEMKAELMPLWGIPANAYGSESYTIYTWLELTTFRHAPAGEITVFVSPNTPSGNASGPNQRKTIQMPPSLFGVGQAFTFAHELGHYFGLSHINAPTQTFDARANAYASMADLWDLIYFPGCGTPGCGHVFFTKRDEALPCVGAVNSLGQGLAPIERCVQQPCTQSCNFLPANGEVSCDVGVSPPGPGSYTESYTPTQWQIANRVSFRSFNPVVGAGGTCASCSGGGNLMAYTSNSLNGAQSLSESQALLVRSALRYDTQFLYKDDTMVEPTPYTVRGGRVVEGDTQPQAPLFKLDLDGDGQRELVFWDPPLAATGANGRFRVLFSTTGYAVASALTLDMGAGTHAAVPVAGDVNGDGRSDLGVYIPGSSLPNSSTWRFCPTAATPATTACPVSFTTVALGRDTSVPAGLHRMQASYVADAPMVFDNGGASGTWRWNYAAGSGVPGAGTPVSSSPMTGAGVTTWEGGVALAGQYTADERADLVMYLPSNATFYSMLSTSNWSNTVATPFASVFIASGAGSAATRAGGVPVKNMYWRSGVGGARLALALWEPELGRWDVRYDPFGTPQVLTNCAYGVGGDLPIGGLGLGGGSAGVYSFSSLGIYRSGALAAAPLVPGQGYLFREAVASVATSNSAPLPCPTSHAYNSLGVLTTRWPLFSVGDMSGDGLADVLAVDPDLNDVTLFGSPYYPFTMWRRAGDARSEFLLPRRRNHHAHARPLHTHPARRRWMQLDRHEAEWGPGQPRDGGPRWRRSGGGRRLCRGWRGSHRGQRGHRPRRGSRSGRSRRGERRRCRCGRRRHRSCRRLRGATVGWLRRRRRRRGPVGGWLRWERRSRRHRRPGRR